jgi:putative ABC transport system substrate-binding protein
VRRREFISLLGSTAVACPIAAWAQQLPMIGFLSSASPDLYSDRLRTFREGLKEIGYVEGQNVAIEYRWAEGQNDRLPTLAADLVRLQVAVIVAAGGTPSALAAKTATATIPIVFAVGTDPIEAGLVASLNRPGGNLTGVTNLNAEIGPKRLELLHELLPTAVNIAVLVDPTTPILNEEFLRGVQTAASKMGLQLHVLNARTEQDFDLDTVFATLDQLRAAGLVIAPSTFFNGLSARFAALALRHGIPTIFQFRPFAAAGGLVSYGSEETDYYRLVGAYAGKILKGEKPSELPVQQSTKIELIINLKTAKTLGITVPVSLLGRADEVIE